MVVDFRGPVTIGESGREERTIAYISKLSPGNIIYEIDYDVLSETNAHCSVASQVRYINSNKKSISYPVDVIIEEPFNTTGHHAFQVSTVLPVGATNISIEVRMASLDGVRINAVRGIKGGNIYKMARGRKNGCPVNIKNWLVYILDPSTNDFVRIYGLNSLTATVDSETEDGSADTDIWSEPYISKRSGSVSLEGKKVVTESTGDADDGQELLNYYAETAGCDADATLKFVDAYGHTWVADYIVTSREDSVDDSGDNYSWSLEQVGEADVLAYKHVSSIALNDGTTEVTTLSMAVGDTPKIITVAFTPDDSSNQRFRVRNTKRTIANIGNVTDTGFTITPVAAGTTTITVTSVEGEKTATIALTVTAS